MKLFPFSPGDILSLLLLPFLVEAFLPPPKPSSMKSLEPTGVTHADVGLSFLDPNLFSHLSEIISFVSPSTLRRRAFSGFDLTVRSLLPRNTFFHSALMVSAAVSPSSLLFLVYLDNQFTRPRGRLRISLLNMPFACMSFFPPPALLRHLRCSPPCSRMSDALFILVNQSMPCPFIPRPSSERPRLPPFSYQLCAGFLPSCLLSDLWKRAFFARADFRYVSLVTPIKPFTFHGLSLACSFWASSFGLKKGLCCRQIVLFQGSHLFVYPFLKVASVRSLPRCWPPASSLLFSSLCRWSLESFGTFLAPPPPPFPSLRFPLLPLAPDFPHRRRPSFLPLLPPFSP